VSCCIKITLHEIFPRYLQEFFSKLLQWQLCEIFHPLEKLVRLEQEFMTLALSYIEQVMKKKFLTTGSGLNKSLCPSVRWSVLEYFEKLKWRFRD